jgi:hypothetical protein
MAELIVGVMAVSFVGVFALGLVCGILVAPKGAK